MEKIKFEDAHQHEWDADSTPPRMTCGCDSVDEYDREVTKIVYCPIHGDLLAATRSYRCENAPKGHEHMFSRTAVSDATTEEIESLRGIAETHAFCADRLSIETERADRIAREVCDRGCSYTGGPDEECSAHGRTPRELWEFIAQDVVGRDAATERAEKAEAERDAALAAIERVKEMHRPESNERYTWCVGCSTDEYAEDWPCPTVAALDGAPEPEEKL